MFYLNMMNFMVIGYLKFVWYHMKPVFIKNIHQYKKSHISYLAFLQTKKMDAGI